MAARQKLHEIYAEKMMKRNDYGYPLYEPVSSLEIRPGRCGYIDEHGKWNPVVDLCSAEELAQKGLKPFDDIPDRALDDKGIEWGPKFSETVSGARVDLKGGLSAEALGLPGAAACVYQFSSSSNFGAVLMTEPKVWREGFYHDSPFEGWVKKNCATIIQKRPEVKEHGLWVVKWIYTTSKCSLNAWTDKDKSVTIGFKANMVAIGEFAPQGTWFEASRDGGWVHSTAEDGERKVVFMGGLYFRWRRFAKANDSLKKTTTSKPRWIFRGAEDEEGFKVNIDGEEYEMLCDRVGSVDVEDHEDEDVF